MRARKDQVKVPVKHGPAKSAILTPALQPPHAPEMLKKGLCPCSSNKKFNVRRVSVLVL